MSETPDDTIDPSDRPSPRRGAFRVFVTALVFVMVGGLLNPTAVLDWANGQPIGWRRDTTVEVAQQLDQISDGLGLDEPRRAAADALDWSPTVTTLAPRTAPVTEPPPPTTSGSPAPTTGTGTPTTAAPTTTTTPVATRQASVEDPLRILTVGDSMMVDLQPGLSRLLETQGVATLDAHGAFFLGLTSAQSGYLEENLNAEWARYVAAGDPDAVVVLVGAADFDAAAPAGEPLVSGSPEWQAWIARRANDVMGILTAGGAHVYWLSTPLMRSEKFAAVPQLNEIFDDLEQTWPGWVTVIDTMESLGDADGNYRDVLTYLDGRIEPLRKNDGVHFYDNGADLLSAQIARTMVADGWFSPEVLGDR